MKPHEPMVNKKIKQIHILIKQSLGMASGAPSEIMVKEITHARCIRILPHIFRPIRTEPHVNSSACSCLVADCACSGEASPGGTSSREAVMTFRAQVFGVSSLGIRVLILSLSVGFACDLGVSEDRVAQRPRRRMELCSDCVAPLKDDVKAILRRSHVCKSFP